MRRPSHTPALRSSLNGTSFSTVAPLATRAEVGTPRVTEAAAPCAAMAPVASGPCRHRVHLAVRRQQRRHQQHPAGQVGRVAERRDRDIDALAAAREGGQVGGDHHRGDVLGLQLRRLIGGVDAEPFQHPDERLAGEHRVVELIAGVVEADHQSVADKLVGTHAFDVGDVLDPGLRAGRDRPQREGAEQQRD